MTLSEERRIASGKRIPTEHTETIRRLYLAGAPLREIAAATGCSVANVSARAHRMGLPHRQVSSGSLPQKAMERAYREGLSTDEIAARCGTCQSTVLSILRARGLQIRSRGTTIVKDNRAECVRMYRAGMFHREIAAALGMTPHQVGDRIRSVIGTGSHADGGRRRGARDKIRRATA